MYSQDGLGGGDQGGHRDGDLQEGVFLFSLVAHDAIFGHLQRDSDQRAHTTSTEWMASLTFPSAKRRFSRLSRNSSRYSSFHPEGTEQ